MNQMLPSGPATSPSGELPGFKPALNSVIVPVGVIRPIAGVVPRVGEPEVAVRAGDDLRVERGRG